MRGSHIYERRDPSGSPHRNTRTVDLGEPKYTPQFSLYQQHKDQREKREQLEYQKIQSENQRSYEINQMSLGIRDRIIATYRAEIESHKLNERDFTSLRAQIEDLRRRKEQYDINVTQLQGDYEAQISSQQNVISSL